MNRVDLRRPDPFACLHHDLEIEAAQLTAAGIALVTLSADQSPLTAVAAALRFPTYYGHNWDALEECLHDLEHWWPATAGWVMTVSGAEAAAWRPLDAIWLRAAARHATAGRAMHLVYQSRPAKAQ